MIHPHTEVRYIDENIGRGLFATSDIPKGTIIWVMDRLDREITLAELSAYDDPIREILLTYSYRNSRGNYIFCWDNGRYINHSFSPNCCLTPLNLELAIRDIQAGEELTDDYGYLNIIEPFTALPEQGERTTVYPDDLLRYADIWDASIADALLSLQSVNQPLQPFFSDAAWQEIMEICDGKKPMPSIKTCYFSGK